MSLITLKSKVVQLIDKAQSTDTLSSFLANTMTEYTTEDEFTFGTKRLSCPSLERFIATNATGTINSYTFYGCANIKYLDLGRVSTISNNALIGLHLLEALVLRNKETPTVLASLFNSNYSISRNNYTVDGKLYYCYFYVPRAMLESYKEANNWKNYTARFRAIEDYPEITGGAV